MTNLLEEEIVSHSQRANDQIVVDKLAQDGLEHCVCWLGDVLLRHQQEATEPLACLGIVAVSFQVIQHVQQLANFIGELVLHSLQFVGRQALVCRLILHLGLNLRLLLF